VPARKAISSSDSNAEGDVERAIGVLVTSGAGFAGTGNGVFTDGSPDGTMTAFAQPGQFTEQPAADASITIFLRQSGQENLMSNSREPHARMCFWQ